MLIYIYQSLILIESYYVIFLLMHYSLLESVYLLRPPLCTLCAASSAGLSHPPPQVRIDIHYPFVVLCSKANTRRRLSLRPWPSHVFVQLD